MVAVSVPACITPSIVSSCIGVVLVYGCVVTSEKGGRRWWDIVEYMCVFFTLNRSFYPSDIQHTQCPRWFILERYKFCGHKATIHAATLYQVDSNNTMQCLCAGLWQTQHTYSYASYPNTLKEREIKTKKHEWDETANKWIPQQRQIYTTTNSRG